MIDDREGWLYGSCGGGFNYLVIVMVTSPTASVRRRTASASTVCQVSLGVGVCK